MCLITIIIIIIASIYPPLHSEPRGRTFYTLHMYACIYIYIHTHIHVYISLSLYIYIYIYIYFFFTYVTYIYIHIYICTYTTYTFTYNFLHSHYLCTINILSCISNDPAPMRTGLAQRLGVLRSSQSGLNNT